MDEDEDEEGEVSVTRFSSICKEYGDKSGFPGPSPDVVTKREAEMQSQDQVFKLQIFFWGNFFEAVV